MGVHTQVWFTSEFCKNMSSERGWITYANPTSAVLCELETLRVYPISSVLSYTCGSQILPQGHMCQHRLWTVLEMQVLVRHPKLIEIINFGWSPSVGVLTCLLCDVLKIKNYRHRLWLFSISAVSQKCFLEWGLGLFAWTSLIKLSPR